ncbi:hypothetical protein BDK51DRAFT_39388 [Blyttiomyces helicus]|uniref:Uncharacterized protein n=1 Tax=Blyttiomyces helicus TaxID=388810 RepID=A0A4P9VVV9_9FUNG|nr:hypothetical protein BDK51DRAFT_39388 [Blyttiomyces helicus]|eukprot:RKO83814.1 hypothetical protein BDK51DRAFT_39388 [Blyttiomyces helicus]
MIRFGCDVDESVDAASPPGCVPAADQRWPLAQSRTAPHGVLNLARPRRLEGPRRLQMMRSITIHFGYAESRLLRAFFAFLTLNCSNCFHPVPLARRSAHSALCARSRQRPAFRGGAQPEELTANDPSPKNCRRRHFKLSFEGMPDVLALWFEVSCSMADVCRIDAALCSGELKGTVEGGRSLGESLPAKSSTEHANLVRYLGLGNEMTWGDRTATVTATAFFPSMHNLQP